MKRLMILPIFLLAICMTLLWLGGQQFTIAQGTTSEEVFLPVVSSNSLFVNWAFQETFDGDPASPSQDLLPKNFDYVVTHRTHPQEHFDSFEPYLADHNDQCAGPNPDVSPIPQHSVYTSHESNGKKADQSFFICKNHMMSSMGDVSAYTVTSFWPRQDFDFKNGGYLEFDVNINDGHPRSWFEVLIAPRSELKVATAPHDLPIDEKYPKNRIVLRFYYDLSRTIQVGTGELEPLGIVAQKSEWSTDGWAVNYPNDPALQDRRIRRTMRIYISDNQIVWSIEKQDGSFDDFVLDVPGDLPFTRGLVIFKTHAYTPEKDGNTNSYTFHWDNIRFSGPVVGRYENYEAEEVVYLQAGGDRPIGEQKTVTIDLPDIGENPLLFGQVHSPKAGQVLLSINGRSNIEIHPYDYNDNTCSSTGWKSFQQTIDPDWLTTGTNTFTWTIGPRPNCAEDWLWDGFSIKDLEIQFDLAD